VYEKVRVRNVWKPLTPFHRIFSGSVWLLQVNCIGSCDCVSVCTVCRVKSSQSSIDWSSSAYRAPGGSAITIDEVERWAIWSRPVRLFAALALGSGNFGS